MSMHRHKIPLLLRLKRAKNSRPAEALNLFLSILKPSKSFKGIPQRILFIRNDRIGDAVVTLPVIRNIKLNYPEIKIDVLVSQRNKFVFEDFEHADDVIELEWTPDNLNNIYKIPFLGGILQFFRYVLLPSRFSSSLKEKIKYLKSKQYDVSVDLVGLKRNIWLSRKISQFIIGPGKLGMHILYDYYHETNWVSLNDKNFMTLKIEDVMEKSLGLKFVNRDTDFPLTKINGNVQESSIYDLIVHLGTSDLRKFPLEKEKQLIEAFGGCKLLITDSYETERFENLKEVFANNGNVQFRIFNSLQELAGECLKAKLLLCYDGGQAHYLSQFIRTCIIFGPGSVELWKPYEFEEYSFLKKDLNGAHAIISEGKYRHIVFYYPVWCSPCFDVGCKERPCLGEIRIEFISSIINKHCLPDD